MATTRQVVENKTVITEHITVSSYMEGGILSVYFENTHHTPAIVETFTWTELKGCQIATGTLLNALLSKIMLKY